MTNSTRIPRRTFLGAGATLLGTGLAAPALAQMAGSTEMEAPVTGSSRHNLSAFRTHDWREHFESPVGGMILCDIASRALHFWSEDQSVYRLFPTSVPASDDLTRLGYTQIVEKKENPTWRPTPSMRERNPEWPEVVPGGDPMNPLGVRALYLSWEFYRIHGTHDTRKIGRRSSNGCVGLYNEHIIQLYDLAQVGTQVKLI
jgi:L,D-transpeptidase ErfK/SrfK